MADFCKQCSNNIFGDDFRELAGLVKEGEFADVICEGCGFITVDYDGRCVTPNCLEDGHQPEIVCPVVEMYQSRRKSEDDIPF